ncbi:methyltransferase domain-containing protein [Streptomyces sp. NBC_01017]|uniref:class I SAM-dependent methyltransferase n=1 Tax=Streptomyces sp. NBC_01017 TaxID=2903721 RepID=UPI00386B3455|nr:methyltransferase domain-containing protein [Streptomyces sp. NBC_01017]
MVDQSFADPALAALYDTLNPWGPGDDFYLELVRAAGAVLDVGCGTGRLLRRARAGGHRGRLVGLDPAAAMLVEARRHGTDVEWVLGDLRTQDWCARFDLVVMTGHAFQVLLRDEELRTSLLAVHRALRPGGRFVFETRNPAARAWEMWTPERARTVTGADGAAVRVWHDLEGPVVGDLVTFTETYACDTWPAPAVSRTTLRFLAPDALSALLAEAGLTVADQYGDWARTPVTPTAPEIITVARRAS